MAKKKAVKKKSIRKAAKKPGLYTNIHEAQKRAKRGGKPVRKKGAKEAPKNSDFPKAKKTVRN